MAAPRYNFSGHGSGSLHGLPRTGEAVGAIAAVYVVEVALRGISLISRAVCRVRSTEPQADPSGQLHLLGAKCVTSIMPRIPALTW